MKVLRAEPLEFKHARIVQSQHRRGNAGMLRLPRRSRLRLNSHPRDHLHLLQALPRQTEHQSVELLLRQRHRRRSRRRLSRPHEAALVQASRRAPDAEPVVHKKLDSRGASVGEQVPMMRLRATEDMHHACEQTIGAGPHVHRLDCEPQCVDADHRSNSRSHSADSVVAGIVTVATSVPRRISIRSSRGSAHASGVGAIGAATPGGAMASGMNVCTGPWTADATADLLGSCRRHLCTRLALSPCAIATLATEFPARHSSSTAFFSSGA